MHRRVSRALLAAAAAGAVIATQGLTAAGASGAAMGPHGISFAPSAPVVPTHPCSDADGFISLDPAFTFGGGGCAGYVASGRDFRYAQSIITVPQGNVIPDDTTPHEAAAPTMYIGLTSADAMAMTGLITCTNYVAEFGPAGPCGEQSPSFDTWVGFGAVVTSNGAAVAAEAVNLGPVNPGDGVEFHLYYPAGGAAHFAITTGISSPAATVTAFQLPAAGTFHAVFGHAVALVDYSASDLGGSPARPGLDPGPAQVPPGTPSPVDLRITQFQMGGWTTTSGQRGTFAGPWVLASPASTSNGTAPPSGTINVEPAFLWNDGLGGGFGDAFGVWWRH